jgi:hypothetical protein
MLVPMLGSSVMPEALDSANVPDPTSGLILWPRCILKIINFDLDNLRLWRFCKYGEQPKMF